MDRFRGVPTRRSALVALVAVLVMFVGVTNAYAGGRDHGNSTGQQDWATSGNDTWQSGDENSSGDWSSGDKSDSADSSSNQDQNGEDCKNQGQEGQPGEQQTGEQGESEVPPPTGYGGEQGENAKGGEQNYPGKQGENGKKGKGGETESKGGTTPTQAGQTPAPVTSAPVTTAPAAIAPASTQAQQAPTQGGEVLGESEQSPSAGNQGSPEKRGGRVLAENQVAAATSTASQGGGLASTGFDAWQLALLGALCIAGSALLLRRTRRS